MQSADLTACSSCHRCGRMVDRPGVHRRSYWSEIGSPPSAIPPYPRTQHNNHARISFRFIELAFGAVYLLVVRHGALKALVLASSLGSVLGYRTASEDTVFLGLLLGLLLAHWAEFKDIVCQNLELDGCRWACNTSEYVVDSAYVPQLALLCIRLASNTPILSHFARTNCDGMQLVHYSVILFSALLELTPYPSSRVRLTCSARLLASMYIMNS